MTAAAPSTTSNATSVPLVVRFGFQLWSGLEKLRNP